MFRNGVRSNSAVMLTRLEDTYATADGQVIAIALTTGDMFNPGEQSGASRDGRAQRRELVGVQGSPTIQHVNWSTYSAIAATTAWR